MRNAIIALVTAAAVSGCSMYKRAPVEFYAVGGSGMAMMMTGAFVYTSGHRQCRDLEFREECTADDTYNIVAIVFLSAGLVAMVVAGALAANHFKR